MLLLRERSVFSLSGPDVQEFLQGIVTNDVYKLSAQPIYTFLLSPQGKHLYDFFLVSHNDQILVEYEESHKGDIVQLLKKYKVGVKVSLKSTKYTVYSSFVSCNIEDTIQFTDPRSQNMGYRIFSTKELPSSSDVTQYEIQRIKSVIPDGKKDLISGRSFPFECDMDCAFDSNKGCYIGQEVVARTVSRGVIRKKLFMVECDIGEILPTIGTEILDKNNNKLGEVRSSVENIGLALLRIEEVKLALASKVDIVTSEVKIKIHGL